MAFSGGGSGGSGRGRGSRWRSTGTLTEMNVVPLVDVVLVLLIIFMITASAMEFGLEIEVPEVKNTQTSVEERPVVSIDRQNAVYLGADPVNVNEIGITLEQEFPGETNVYLRVDRDVRWEQMASVVEALSDAQYAVSVVTRAADLPGN